MATYTRNIRTGLPRVPGGEPWPVGGEISARAQTIAEFSGPAVVPSTQTTEMSPAQPPTPVEAVPARVAPATLSTGPRIDVVLRRGLPRAPGGEPWPYAETTAVVASVASGPGVAEERVAFAATEIDEASLTSVDSVPQTATESAPALPAREQRVIRGRTVAQWVKTGILSVVGLIALAGVIVLAARGVTTLPGVPEFLQRYRGEYHSAIPVEEGFPAWARWTHFLNFFFIVLIIRSGLLVRHQQPPSAFYAPKRGGKKISIYLWLHTSLDALWMVNGIVFVILLFVTGHWVRIVPTSWEVFPNAASAMLQYLTLNWPVENGWVNYNSLQQLMYFTVVFIAAPLAAITGGRMSEWWPQRAEVLNRLYPAPLARVIHFPAMLFFVLFVVIHVFLVLATGALRNLNHMFVGTDVVNWAGFWWFAAGLVVTAGALAAARPLVLAPIAGITGRVSQR